MRLPASWLWVIRSFHAEILSFGGRGEVAAASSMSIVDRLHQRLRPCLASDPWPSHSINTQSRILQTYVTWIIDEEAQRGHDGAKEATIQVLHSACWMAAHAHAPAHALALGARTHRISLQPPTSNTQIHTYVPYCTRTINRWRPSVPKCSLLTRATSTWLKRATIWILYSVKSGCLLYACVANSSIIRLLRTVYIPNLTGKLQSPLTFGQPNGKQSPPQ
jgi:hypothetical protein